MIGGSASELHMRALRHMLAARGVPADPEGGGYMQDQEPGYIYFGNLLPREEQYKSGLFRGLALAPKYDRDIAHDARQRMLFADDSVRGFQSQDVFEHIAFEKLPAILDDIYRCLCPGGIFRMSVPDYHAAVLRRRSVYDADGRILCDLMMGGRVESLKGDGVQVHLAPGGGSHLCFPTHDQVLRLILASKVRKCETITVHQAWLNAREFVCNEFEQSIMPVTRTPGRDARAEGKPLSIVVDFVK